MKTFKIEFTANELEEVLAKLANELDMYGNSATNELKNAFLKVNNVVKENKLRTTLLSENL